jgi:hypothetical protein
MQARLFHIPVVVQENGDLSMAFDAGDRFYDNFFSVVL